MSVSILSYIPSTEHPNIAARTSTYDSSTAFQNAINALHTAGGGTLYVPAGKYRLNSTITNKPRVSLLGDGRESSTLEWSLSHTGHGIQQLATLNSSTPVHNVIEKIGLISLSGSSNTGGGFYDRGGTYVQLINCQVVNFKYGIILDQSELVDIDLCDIVASTHSNIWLVNGAETSLGNTGASFSYTNRISVKRCQLNIPGQFQILDDGGYAHSFVDNNYNGGITHIRAAGAEGLVIQGGEFEAATSMNIYLTFTRLSGSGVGVCVSTLIAGTFISPTSGNNCIQTFGASKLTLIGNLFANTNDPDVASVNCSESSQVFSIGNHTESDGPMFQGAPYLVRWSAEALIEGSVTSDVGSIAPGASAFVDLSLAGVAVGDRIDQVTSSVDLGDDINLSARVSGDDNVRIKLTNSGTSAVNPPVSAYTARVERKAI